MAAEAPPTPPTKQQKAKAKEVAKRKLLTLFPQEHYVSQETRRSQRIHSFSGRAPKEQPKRAVAELRSDNIPPALRHVVPAGFPAALCLFCATEGRTTSKFALVLVSSSASPSSSKKKWVPVAVLDTEGARSVVRIAADSEWTMERVAALMETEKPQRQQQHVEPLMPPQQQQQQQQKKKIEEYSVCTPQHQQRPPPSPTRSKRPLDRGTEEAAAAAAAPTPIDAVLAAADKHWCEIFDDPVKRSAPEKLTWPQFLEGVDKFYRNAPNKEAAEVFLLSSLLSVKAIIDMAEWRRFFFHFRNGSADNTDRYKVAFSQAVRLFAGGEQTWFSGSLLIDVIPEPGYATVRYSSSHVEALVLSAHDDNDHGSGQMANVRIGNHRPGDRFILTYEPDSSMNLTVAEFNGDHSTSFFYVIPKAGNPIEVLHNDLNELVRVILANMGFQCKMCPKPKYTEFTGGF